jgi:hypothetical protein
LIAIAVAAIMTYTAFGVGRQSFNQLMDRELPEAERARICRIAQSHAAVRNVHDLKTRTAGLSTFIQLHLALDPKMSLAEAHAISDAVEMALGHAYPGAEVIIHQDPDGLEPVETARLENIFSSVMARKCGPPRWRRLHFHGRSRCNWMAHTSWAMTFIDAVPMLRPDPRSLRRPAAAG